MDHLHYTSKMDGVLTGLPRKLAAHRTPFEMRSSAELCHYTKEISSVIKPLLVKMLMSEIASHAAGTMPFSRNLTLSLL